MTYDSLIQTLIDSRPEDWLRNEDEKVLTFKRDLNVTVRERREAHVGTLDEPWAVFGHHGPADIRIFEVWYGASFVGKYNFALVDGGRALLPFPQSNDHLRITRIQLAIALAVNRQDDSLHRYLHMAGIAVEQQD
jgi:hypothetical protein